FKTTYSPLVSKRKRVKLEQRAGEINSSWKLIYRNPFIFPISFLVRFKIYHTFLCILVSSACCYYYVEGSLSEAQLALCTVSLFIVLLLLFGYSILYQRLVGRIYISNDSKRLRFAHVNFWGNREDVTLPIDKVIPISDTNEKLNTFHIKIALNGSPQTYYMNFGAKSIISPDDFAMAFGHNPHPAFYDDIALSEWTEEFKKRLDESKTKSNSVDTNSK
ncbi:transmembrane protein 186-like, partial [Panonychus citri]|uniref:transmembrane protein 186-like n=1 Tax=Panonychus citri TaxID=50023 RepID=UPI0023079DD4